MAMSKEQELVIEHLKNSCNVQVDSVAGGGKTTTIMHIAKELPDKKCFCLVFNKQIQEETQNRIEKLGLSNIEVKTFHSAAGVIFNRKGLIRDDASLKNALNNPPIVSLTYDVVIIDEAQDLNETYYKFICFVCSNIVNRFQIVILGDKRQKIYEHADDRYFLNAEETLTFNYNDYEWKYLKLSHSYRLTNKMADFLNHCMYSEKFIIAEKESNELVEYVKVRSWETIANRFVYIIDRYIKSGYLASDFFILTYSIGDGNGKARPINYLIDSLSEKYGATMPIAVLSSKHMEVDIDKKLVVSTIHQVKGLERKIVIVYGFDMFWVKKDPYEKNKVEYNDYKNLLYVACTRALEKLYVVSIREDLKDVNFDDRFFHISGKPLKADNICTPSIVNMGRKDTVTRIIKRLRPETILKCLDLIETKTSRYGTGFYNVTNSKSTCTSLYNVSDINGIYIPALYFNKRDKNQDLLYTIQNRDDINVIAEKHARLFIEGFRDNEYTEKLLQICTLYNGLDNNMHRYISFETYDWINESECRDFFLNMDKLCLCECEYSLEKPFENEKVTGRVDYINEHSIYEFKCTKTFDKTDYLQIIMYRWLTKSDRDMFLYNILTGELVQITLKVDINQIIDCILKVNAELTVNLDSFLENCKSIRKIFQERIPNEESTEIVDPLSDSKVFTEVGDKVKCIHCVNSKPIYKKSIASHKKSKTHIKNIEEFLKKQ